MNFGMLWFDNDSDTALPVKICRAAGYYQQKYGLIPDVCLVHPSVLVQSPLLVEWQAGIVEVRPNRAVQPGHLWIGAEEK